MLLAVALPCPNHHGCFLMVFKRSSDIIRGVNFEASFDTGPAVWVPLLRRRQVGLQDSCEGRTLHPY
jgi:hypothetical protein